MRRSILCPRRLTMRTALPERTPAAATAAHRAVPVAQLAPRAGRCTRLEARRSGVRRPVEVQEKAETPERVTAGTLEAAELEAAAEVAWQEWAV